VTLAHIASVNVGAARTVEWAGRHVTTAIWKRPVVGAVRVAGVNLAGDDQADRRVHGGADKAVYAYAAEDYEWWKGDLGTGLAAGTFGENLTTVGIALQRCVVGQRWRVGSTVLEVAQPRMPCFKLGIRMGDAHFVERFEEARRWGAYLRIIGEGAITAGDAVVLEAEPDHGLTIGDIGAAFRESPSELLHRIATIADVPEGWRDWAARQLARSAGRELGPLQDDD
jgi:MOSC domain-containing protein YiiM